MQFVATASAHGGNSLKRQAHFILAQFQSAVLAPHALIDTSRFYRMDVPSKYVPPSFPGKWAVQGNSLRVSSTFLLSLAERCAKENRSWNLLPSAVALWHSQVSRKGSLPSLLRFHSFFRVLSFPRLALWRKKEVRAGHRCPLFIVFLFFLALLSSLLLLRGGFSPSFPIYFFFHPWLWRKEKQDGLGIRVVAVAGIGTHLRNVNQGWCRILRRIRGARRNRIRQAWGWQNHLQIERAHMKWKLEALRNGAYLP